MMPEKFSYEHGARKLMPRHAPDPNDEIAQNAAENRNPPLGIGLSEKVAPRKKLLRNPTRKVAPPEPSPPRYPKGMTSSRET